jgi:hypothetical protein
MRDAEVTVLTDTRPATMRRGDVLLLSPFVPHRSLANTGTRIRWSVELRYAPIP